jgi:hypothetical protein
MALHNPPAGEWAPHPPQGTAQLPTGGGGRVE